MVSFALAFTFAVTLTVPFAVCCAVDRGRHAQHAGRCNDSAPDCFLHVDYHSVQIPSAVAEVGTMPSSDTRRGWLDGGGDVFAVLPAYDAAVRCRSIHSSRSARRNRHCRPIRIAGNSPVLINR